MHCAINEMLREFDNLRAFVNTQQGENIKYVSSIR